MKGEFSTIGLLALRGGVASTNLTDRGEGEGDGDAVLEY